MTNQSDITRKLCENILAITEVSSAFVWLTPQEGVKSTTLRSPENKYLEEIIANALGQAWDNLRNEVAAMIQIVDSWYYLTPVKTMTRFYGFIGVPWDEAASVESKERLLQIVRALAEWSTIIYEQIHSENVKAKLIIEMEQKRIGEEIHDLVSGRLFSVVCATSVLARSPEVNEKDREKLKLISSTVNQAISELRSIIYSLNAKSSERRFEQQIKRYLDEVAKLHGISVSLVINEESASLGGHQARALHRIICEAVANSVRHGHCKNICVELINEGADLCLTIRDDGIGFEPAISVTKQQGLGLDNIKSLANSLHAILTIESHSGHGTRIRIIVPNQSLKITSEKKYEGEAS